MTEITVRRAHRSEWPAALALLFGREENSREQVTESLAAEKRGELSLAGLIVAEEAGHKVGAGLFAPQPGRVAFVWPPEASRDHPRQKEIRRTLLGEIGRRLDELKICLGQAVLDPRAWKTRAEFEEAGFSHLTDLHYMIRPADSLGPVEDSDSSLEFDSFQETNAERFARVLERTYIGTLDCPELDGLRTPEEALAGHQAAGQFDPVRWRLFRRDGRDVGLVLVNEHPDREMLELVYLGVVPEARGRGWGRSLGQRAIDLARRENRSLVLGVDRRNHLARKIYDRLGFLDLTRQSVHIRPPANTSLGGQSTAYAQPATGKKKIS